MYARKILSTRLIRHEFGIENFILIIIYLIVCIYIDIFINSSHNYSQKKHDFLARRCQQLRSYSISNILLTRSGNSSYTIRDGGQNSKGYFSMKYSSI
jgi:hypothetical protein